MAVHRIQVVIIKALGIAFGSIQSELHLHISSFITDSHREFIVRPHARGLSTSVAVLELVSVDKTMNRLADADAMGLKELREALILRLAYLKPGTARLPEKKYGKRQHLGGQNYSFYGL